MIESEPAGATISYARYGTDVAWQRLGTTPLNGARLPLGLLRLKAEKPGFDTAEDVILQDAGAHAVIQTRCLRSDARTGWCARPPYEATSSCYVFGLATPRLKFDGFWIDRYEVTNREYKRFLDAGGYKRREFWHHPFVQGGKSLSFDEAVCHVPRCHRQAWSGVLDAGQLPVR